MKKAIGIDLGGTSINGGIVDEKGEILSKFEYETGKNFGSYEVLRRIALVIQELLNHHSDIEIIGIGSPGFIDSVKGRVLVHGGNIAHWAGTDIKGILEKRFPNRKIYVENDANVAGVCEAWYGAGKDFQSFIMITLGTGLGGCIYTKEQGIWHGHNFQGGELGHAILYPNGRLCTCGQKGCVERYVSGTAVEIMYYEETNQIKSSKEIFKVYEEDENAKKIIHEFADNLAIYIASIKNIFDSEGIIIGGGLINARYYWWDRMIKSYNDYVNNPVGMKIVPADYLNDAGIIGAAKIAFDNMKRV
ncbi:ROK family protein [Tissierella creatinini]|nr:ROK family protein [Tissierella creatinini]TJX66730.1 ROK family protein [Soehngenia saccharolytica]